MKQFFLTKWKPTLIWLSAYMNFIAFALVGGYVLVTDEDETLKNAAKTAIVVTLIFAGVSALLSVYSYIGGFFDSYYNSAAYEIYSVLSTLNGIARIGTYSFFIIRELFKKDI